MDDTPRHPRARASKPAPTSAHSPARSAAARTSAYDHEMRLAKHPALRYAFAGLGLTFTGIGIIGVFVPGLPTTVFILIAAYFFARSSPRFYAWLMEHRLFGPLVRDWRAGRGLSAKAKAMAVATLAVTITLSAWVLPSVALKVVVALCGVGVALYLLTRPTKRPTPGEMV